jgi:hypothetical protein
MGYKNPLLQLPAGKALLALPETDRRRIEAVMRELRHQANKEAENAWARRKAPMAAYWRATSTYARHLAHALSRGVAPAADVSDGQEGLKAALEIARRGLAQIRAEAASGTQGRVAQMCADIEGRVASTLAPRSATR